MPRISMIIIYTNLSKGDMMVNTSTTEAQHKKRSVSRAAKREGKGEGAPQPTRGSNLRSSLKFSKAPSKMGRVNGIKIKIPFKGILNALRYCPPV